MLISIYLTSIGPVCKHVLHRGLKTPIMEVDIHIVTAWNAEITEA